MPRRATAVLLAHGSTKDDASRSATVPMADRLAALDRFRGVRIAFLDEPPSLDRALADVPGPVVVVGLFVGGGLHGAGDVPGLVARLGRADVASTGSVGAWPEIADVVAAAVEAAGRSGARLPPYSAG